MYKKISGQDDMLGMEAVHRVMKNAKNQFLDTMDQLRAKKDEYKDIKKQNDEERRILLEEERKAKSFKFTKMEKKTPFLPSIKQREGFEGYKSLAPGEKFLDSRPKYQILFPQRALEKGLKFKQYIGGNTGGDFFQKMVGQENDKYDEEMKKAMTRQERGLTITRIRTKNTFTTADGMATFPLFETKINRTDRVWSPNNFTMNLLQHKTPLMIERVETPRAVKKMTTLERNFDRDVWVYNKRSLDELANSTAKDVKKGKFYKRRIMRKKRQRSRSMGASGQSTKTQSLSGTR